MRTPWLFVAGLVCVCATNSAVRAGLYMPSEPLPWPLPLNPKHYLQLQQERQNVASPDPKVQKSPLRERVEKLVNRLEAKKAKEPLTADEIADLGGAYILQLKYNEAINLLEPAAREQRRNSILWANLVVAYQGINEYRRALEFQQDVLVLWPGKQPGWTPEQLRWYRRVEESYRTLLRVRARETPQQARELRLDALFPEMNTLGTERPFVPGGFDPALAANLPPDALAIVEQLLLWLPHDQRLLWLYAELLNGQGDKVHAEQMLSQLVMAGVANETLKNHRHTLQESIKTDAAKPDTPPAAAKPDTPPALPNWQHIAVGFGSGVVVGILVLLQFRQFGRRASPARPG